MFYVDNYSFCSLGNTTELTIFCVSFPVKGTYEGIFYQSCRLIFTNCNFTKDGLLLQVFFFFFELIKSVDQSFLDGYFYFLLSLKLFSRKKSVLLTLPHLITPLPKLDQSNKIYFAASWWALIIKGRCNVVPTAPLSWALAKGSAVAWLSERTDYKLTNSNFNIRLNPYKVTSIRILIWCSCVSEDTKRVLPLLRFVAI